MTDLSLAYTLQAKKVIELALKEACELRHDFVGTQHALFGLIREQEGVAAQVLANAGIDLDAVREQVRRLQSPGRRSIREASDRCRAAARGGEGAGTGQL